ncbi:MAG: helix-turn-helix transcriptional regulator [Candidatus Omnitrophota bacterium]|jgi:hypothetical protein
MAGKNIEFTGRLKKAIKDTGLNKNVFAREAKIEYNTLMNYLVPKGLGRVPEWDQLVKIADATGKSIDWFLTGKKLGSGVIPGVAEPGAEYGVCKSWDVWPEEIKDACRIVHKIMTSTNKIAKDALHTNLALFEDHETLRNVPERSHPSGTLPDGPKKTAGDAG